VKIKTYAISPKTSRDHKNQGRNEGGRSQDVDRRSRRMTPEDRWKVHGGALVGKLSRTSLLTEVKVVELETQVEPREQ